MRNFKLLFILLLLTTQISAIDINRKFGKVSKEELLMKYCDIDSSAGAVILFDKGNTYFDYIPEKGFVMVYERQVRIKFLNKDEFDYTNFNISLYHSNGNDEKISSLKATTYNLENDKIVKTKLKKSDIYQIEDTPNNTINKFSLPAVREGSVIEVNYIIRSDFFYNLQKWKFQYSIPSMWSEYTVKIPEYFNYNKIAKGYLPFDLNETTTKNDLITITTQTRSGGGSFRNNNGVTKTNYSNQNINLKKKVIQIAIKNAPAMKKEAFMLASSNYISSIEFELASIQFPNSLLKNYSQSWESINKKLMDHSDFGAQLKNGHYLSDVIQNIQVRTDNPRKQIYLLYNFMVNNYKWNERNALYTSKSLRKTFKEKLGNSADLNLLMILLLKEAGFIADPVILSTRNHGLLNPVYPSVSQMNYVVALLKLEGENILIDATDPYCLPGMLPPKCINDKGRVINETNSTWINIEPSEKYSTTVFGNFNITEQNIQGSLSTKREGFASYNFRHKYKSFNNEQDYIAEVESNNPGLKINEYKFENIDSVNKPVQTKFTDLTIESLENLGDIIYFNPVTINRVEENPFKMEKRNYPVDFNYLYDQKYIFNYIIPEGYTVEEIPKSEQIILPEKSGKYKYIINNSGNSIQIRIQLNINKHQFLPEEYSFLKDFYNKIIIKEAEQIVLKKS